jgi:hypothetical protein
MNLFEALLSLVEKIDPDGYVKSKIYPDAIVEFEPEYKGKFTVEFYTKGISKERVRIKALERINGSLLNKVSKNIKAVSDKHPKEFVLSILKKFLSGNMTVSDKETSTLIKTELKEIADVLKEIKKNKEEIKGLKKDILDESGNVYVSVPASNTNSVNIYDYFIFPAKDKKEIYKRNSREKLFRSIYKEVQKKSQALSDSIDSTEKIEKFPDSTIDKIEIGTLIDLFIENYIMRFFFAEENPADVIVNSTVSPSKDVVFKVDGVNIDASVEKFWKEMKRSNDYVKSIKDDKVKGIVGKYILSVTK